MIHRPIDLPDTDHYQSTRSDVLFREYEYLYQESVIDSKWNDQISNAVNTITRNQVMYEMVSAKTGVPFQVVAAIHFMECGLDFMKCIHNGQRWNEVTTKAPEGRGPFKSWWESTIDALTFQGMSNRQHWFIGNTLFWLELYNGLGYRKPVILGNASPYIYSGTQFYSSGKFVEKIGEDGHYHSFFDPNVVSQQPGCIALLRALGYNGQ